MKLSKPVSVALLGLALTATAEAQGQASIQPIGGGLAVDSSASSQKGSFGLVGPTCATGGVASGKWIQPVGKDDELQGFLYDSEGVAVYEMKADMATYMYLTPPGGIDLVGMGGLYGFLYDPAVDAYPPIPVAELFGVWTKSASGVGQFQALVLSNDAPLLQGSILGEIRGQFGPSSLFETPDIATDPPSPDAIGPSQPGVVDLGDDVLIAPITNLRASDQSKAANKSQMGFGSSGNSSPGPGSTDLVPVGSGIAVVSGSAQKVRARDGAGFSLAVKVMPDATDTDLIPLDDGSAASVSGQASQGGSHSAAGLSGFGDSPAGLSWSAKRQRQSQSAGGPSSQGGSQPGPASAGMVSTDDGAAGATSVSGQASQAAGAASMNLANQTTGGFVGTWMLCF